MKKLKRAIANFIIEGKDSWDKLDGNEQIYLCSIILNLRNHFGYFHPENDFKKYWKEEIKKLMPCFFED